MITIPGADEIGKTTRSFFDALKDQPLSIALVVVILALCAMLYYTTSQSLEQRRETANLIIGWQKETDRLMANCVSSDVTKMMLDNVHQVTQTMLATAQKDLDRMQRAVDSEREQTRKLTDDLFKRLQRYVPPPGVPFSPPRAAAAEVCDPAAPFCMPE